MAVDVSDQYWPPRSLAVTTMAAAAAAGSVDLEKTTTRHRRNQYSIADNN